MKIAIVSTHDIRGGAAKAAYRLHEGLLRSGADSRMIVLYKRSADDSVVQIDLNTLMGKESLMHVNMVQDQYVNNNRTGLSNTMFSFPYPGYDISSMPEIRDADVINLHWVTFFQSPMSLRRIFDLGKPVVWTLHDQSAFTGGCHYSAGCDGFRKDCSSCPQLAQDPFNLPARVLKDKMDIFKGANLAIATPSRWLAGLARESVLFRDVKVQAIANSVETDIYLPVPKAAARKNLSIPEEKVVLLVGAETSAERRKGFNELVHALEHCKANPDFRRMVSGEKVALMSFGHFSRELDSTGIPVITLGHIDSDETIRDVYASADAFILPSLEDNLPNTMVESLACGTPVIAFDAGGIPDAVIHGKNGLLVPAFDTAAMGEAILDLTFNSGKRAAMGRTGADRAKEEFALAVQARNYCTLFEEMKPAEPRVEDGKPLPAMGPHLQEAFLDILLKATKEKIDTLTQALKSAKAENITLLEQKAYLETLTGAVGMIAIRVLRIIGLYEFVFRHKDPIYRLYDFLVKIFLSRKAPRPPAGPGIPGRGIDSPLVDALVAARGFDATFDEETLVDFYGLGSEARNVVFIGPGVRNIPLLYMLSSSGVSITCLGWEQRLSDMQGYGFFTLLADLDGWMRATANATLVDFDCVVVDEVRDEKTVDLLKGRLFAGTRVLASTETGASREFTRRGWGEPSSMVGAFALFTTIPADWLC